MEEGRGKLEESGMGWGCFLVDFGGVGGKLGEWVSLDGVVTPQNARGCSVFLSSHQIIT